MNQLRKKIEFKTNLPVQVALAYDDGIHKEDGRFGDYWVYTLDDERIMFVPPIVHDQIEKLRITRGQPFTITKQERRVGPRRVIEWVVGFPDEATEDGATRLHALCEPRTVPELEPQQCPSEPPAGVRQNSGPAEIVQDPASLPFPRNGSAADGRTADHGDAHGNGPPNGGAGDNRRPPHAGKVNGAGPHQNGDPPTPEKANTSPLFRVSMRAAIDALIDAEQYAAERNYRVHFTNEDLRATAISIFIAARDRNSQ